MPDRKPDRAFGLLPKKTAMDLEWATGRTAAPWTREAYPPGHRPAERELPVPRQGESEALPWKKSHLT